MMALISVMNLLHSVGAQPSENNFMMYIPQRLIGYTWMLGSMCFPWSNFISNTCRT